MKLIITTICFLVGVATFSQFKASVATISGYENNINKSPNSYLVNDVLKTKKDLYQTSFYQEGILKLNYKEKGTGSEFNAYINPEIRYYYTEKKANRILLKTGLGYSYFFDKNYEWETNARYKLKDQKGEDLDEAELSTPLGYRVFNFNTGLHARFYKNNRTLLRASYDIKTFDKSEIRNTLYHRYGMLLKFQNFHRIDGKRHKAGFTASFYNRNYTLDYFTKNEIKHRTWQYFNAGVFYSLPLVKGVTIEPALNFEKRSDITNKKYGYSQLRPSLSVGYKDSRIRTKFAFSYSSRNFNSLKASTTEVKNIENLAYKYLKLTLRGTYKLNDDFYMVADNYFLDRKSNNTNLKTKAYRSYNKFYSGLGIRYNF